MKNLIIGEIYKVDFLVKKSPCLYMGRFGIDFLNPEVKAIKGAKMFRPLDMKYRHFIWLTNKEVHELELWYNNQNTEQLIK